MAVDNRVSAYGSLIKSFLALSAPVQPALTEEPGPLQFTVEGQTCTVFALHEQGKLMLQSQVMPLSELAAAQSSAAMRLLHTLNWANAVGTGILALVDDEAQVLVANRLDIGLLDAVQLSERIAELLDSASRLKAILKAMPEVDTPAGAEGVVFEPAAPRPPPIDIQLA